MRRVRRGGSGLLHTTALKSKLSGNEVYYTKSLILLVENVLCSKLHDQKSFIEKPFRINSSALAPLSLLGASVPGVWRKGSARAFHTHIDIVRVKNLLIPDVTV